VKQLNSDINDWCDPGVVLGMKRGFKADRHSLRALAQPQSKGSLTVNRKRPFDLFLRAISLSAVMVTGVLACTLGSTNAGAASKKGVNPCTLLSQSDLQPVLEGTVAKPVRAGTMCTIKTVGANGQPGNFVEVFAFPSTTAAEFKSSYLTAQERSEGNKAVSGIGSLAVVRQAQNEVDALKGSTLITIDVDVQGSNGIQAPIAPATLAFLARKAVAKIK
jgi:hypothetical protein